MHWKEEDVEVIRKALHKAVDRMERVTRERRWHLKNTFFSCEYSFETSSACERATKCIVPSICDAVYAVACTADDDAALDESSKSGSR